MCLKCSHLFNILDARGAISVTERVGVIARIRALAVGVAKAYVEQQTVEDDVASALGETDPRSGTVVGGRIVKEDTSVTTCELSMACQLTMTCELISPACGTKAT